MKLKYRNMYKNDISQVKALEKEYFTDYGNVENDLIKIEHSKHFSKVCLFNNKIIGFILCIIFNKQVQIEVLLVIKEYQNKGIGTALIEMVKQRAIKEQKERIFLYSNNEKAIHLYKKLGFYIVNKRKNDKGEVYELVKDLRGTP